MTEEKFREIFRQYYRLVMKAAYCVLFDADLSQDICQETFLKFLEKVDIVDKTRYAEWLTVCARRKAIDFCKKAYQVHEVVTADRAEKEDTDKMAQRSDSGGKRTGFYNDDMAQMMVHKEFTGTILNSLKAKNTDWYEIMVRTHVMGENDEEIACALGITIGNVRTKRHRMMEWLKQRFQSEYESL